MAQRMVLQRAWDSFLGVDRAPVTRAPRVRDGYSLWRRSLASLVGVRLSAQTSSSQDSDRIDAHKDSTQVFFDDEATTELKKITNSKNENLSQANDGEESDEGIHDPGSKCTLSAEPESASEDSEKEYESTPEPFVQSAKIHIVKTPAIFNNLVVFHISKSLGIRLKVIFIAAIAALGSGVGAALWASYQSSMNSDGGSSAWALGVTTAIALFSTIMSIIQVLRHKLTPPDHTHQNSMEKTEAIGTPVGTVTHGRETPGENDSYTGDHIDFRDSFFYNRVSDDEEKTSQIVDITAAATAGATALAATIGTGLWDDVRSPLQQWLIRFGQRRTQIAMMKLDDAHIELVDARNPSSPFNQEAVRTIWKIRFQDFLTELESPERERSAQQLFELAAEIRTQRDRSGSSVRNQNIVTGGNFQIQTTRDSLTSSSAEEPRSTNSPSEPEQQNEGDQI